MSPRGEFVSLVRRPHTPELDRQQRALPTARVLGEFLDWLCDVENVALMRWVEDPDVRDEGGWIRESRNFAALLAAYLEIDLLKVSDERMALLRCIRAQRHEQEEREKRYARALVAIRSGMSDGV